MSKKQQIHHNLEWWKFSDYVWEENEEKGLHIKPAPGSELIEYNPWELNQKLSSGKFPMPIYGRLLKDNVDLAFDFLVCSAFLERFEQTKDDRIDFDIAERDYLKAKQRLKENIYSFVKEFGLLGIFWQKANRTIYPPGYIPHFEEVKTFENVKDDFCFIDDKELGFNVDISINTELLQYYSKYKKPKKGWKVKGFFIGHAMESYKYGAWHREIVTAKINDKGKEFLKQIDKKKFDKFFSENTVLSSEYLDPESTPGTYYNTHVSNFEFKSGVKRGPKKNETLFTDSSLSFNQLTHEYFRPMSKGCFFFSHNVEIPYYSGVTIDPGTKIEKNINETKRDYSESISEFIDLILSLDVTSRGESRKKADTEAFLKIFNNLDISEKKYHKNKIYNIHSKSNYLQERNIIVSDYSNELNPYSFQTFSLCGAMANMMLWDSIGGKQMSVCSNPKCKKYYFNPGNKLNCSDPCRQASLRYKKKTQENSNLVTEDKTLQITRERMRKIEKSIDDNQTKINNFNKKIAKIAK